MTGRTCPDCGVPVSRMSKSGRCHRHAMAAMHRDPAFQAARRAGIDRHFAKPGARKAAGRRLQVWRDNMPEVDRERLREHGRWLAREVLTPDRVAKSQTPEARARSAAGWSDHKLGWCPPDRRDDYRHLVRVKRLSAAEARAVIEADIARAAEAERRRPRTFEDQLSAVAKGAALVPTFRPQRIDPDFTLGGVATGALS